MKKSIVTIFIVLIGHSVIQPLFSQQKKDYIYLSGTRFTYPLIEAWITSYKKDHPNSIIKLDIKSNDSTNLKIVANDISGGDLKQNEASVKVSRYALLPIANGRNPLFKKNFKRGISQDDLRKIFFYSDNIIVDNNEAKTQIYTIYTRANAASSSIAFANHFHESASKIKGKKVSGEDQWLTVSVQKDTTGITYNNLGYIFDLSKRVPINGIRIIPLALDDNSDQKLFDNLDRLLNFLEGKDSNPFIPEDYVSLIFNKDQKNALMEDFLVWVLHDGQQLVHQYGFLQYKTENAQHLSQNFQ